LRAAGTVGENDGLTELPPLPPRRPISGWTRVLPIVLRIYVIIAVPLVAYTCFRTLKP
jgi:hypothetical protein